MAAVLLQACSTDDIKTFDNNNYLSFKQAAVSYTFAFDSDDTHSVEFDIPVEYAGRYSGSDAVFSFTPVADKSTATEGVEYELLPAGSQVIKAGTNSGAAHIRLLRTAAMKDSTFTLTLAIVANDAFKPGVTDTVRISITDRMIKPDWWTSNPTYNRYLGDYTSAKLLLWFEFMGVTDGTDPLDSEEYVQWLDYGTGQYIYKNYKDSAVKPKVREFDNWLVKEKNNPVDPDTGEPVSEGLSSF